MRMFTRRSLLLLLPWLCLTAFAILTGEAFAPRGLKISARTSIAMSDSVGSSGESSDSKQALRPGILIVGFGGGNGVTTAAGVIANKKNIQWEGPTGRQSPNYLGCITQLPSKGGSGGYRERYGCDIYKNKIQYFCSVICIPDTESSSQSVSIGSSLDY